ncbi:MAG: STAS domain-containing protein [Vampirovibrionales bacterium]
MIFDELPGNATTETQAIRIEARPLEACIVLDLHGDQFTYPYTSSLKTHVETLIEQGHSKFVLNFSDIKMVDSFGLATILSAMKLARAAGGNLALCGVSEAVEKLVKLTHLERVLDIWPIESQPPTT